MRVVDSEQLHLLRCLFKILSIRATRAVRGENHLHPLLQRQRRCSWIQGRGKFLFAPQAGLVRGWDDAQTVYRVCNKC